MKQDDLLWKGIIEDMPEHFIRFFFPGAESIIDFESGFEFLDKELEELFPIDTPTHPRYVDKLMKAFNKGGKEEWILIHIEVQGYHDDEFELRMFRYFYRLFDRHKKPITALAILTDDQQGFKPKQFDYQFLGTNLSYGFNTFKILDQDEANLSSHPNPFALVVLTVLTYLKNKKTNEEGLMRLKTGLFRKMLERKIEKRTMRALVSFLKMYVQFSKPESNLIFENEIRLITNKISTMGIEELILNRAKQEARAEGKAEGKAEVVSNLIEKMGLSNTQAAEIAGVSVQFVQQIREKLEKK